MTKAEAKAAADRPLTEPGKWSLEYEMGGIPSSNRTSPSGAVVWAERELRRKNFLVRTALDVGCGKGRNSLYLADKGMDVTAMDFTPNAIASLVKTAADRGLSQRIRPLVYDVTEDWPIAPASIDLVIDTFCFKHIAPYTSRLNYKANLLRVLRLRGHFLISFASIGDGYYGQYVLERSTNEGEPEYLVADPKNEIQSVLYTRPGVLRFFQPELVLAMEIRNTKPSFMHGQEYRRETYALLLERNPHMVV